MSVTDQSGKSLLDALALVHKKTTFQ